MYNSIWTKKVIDGVYQSNAFFQKKFLSFSVLSPQILIHVCMARLLQVKGDNHEIPSGHTLHQTKALSIACNNSETVS